VTRLRAGTPAFTYPLPPVSELALGVSVGAGTSVCRHGHGHVIYEVIGYHIDRRGSIEFQKKRIGEM
jgi:hypothetical protein